VKPRVVTSHAEQDSLRWQSFENAVMKHRASSVSGSVFTICATVTTFEEDPTPKWLLCICLKFYEGEYLSDKSVEIILINLDLTK
jgi:hypothetical protein